MPKKKKDTSKKSAKVKVGDAPSSTPAGPVWACEKCGMKKNKQEKEKCIVCGAPRPRITGNETPAELRAMGMYGKAAGKSMNLGIAKIGRGAANLNRTILQPFVGKAKAAAEIAKAKAKIAADKAAEKQRELEGKALAYAEKAENADNKEALDKFAGKLSGFQEKVKSAKQKVGDVKRALSPSNIPVVQRMNEKLSHKRKKYLIAKKARMKKIKNAVRVLTGESESDEESDSDEDDSDADPEERAKRAARRSKRAKKAQDDLEDEQAQRMMEELRLKRLKELKNEDAEEEAWKAHTLSLQTRVEAFTLEKTLKELDCMQWLEEMRHRGFDDVGAFANMQERELQEMFIRPRLRKKLVGRAGSYASTIREIHVMEDKSLADRVLERGADTQLSFDGVHFFATIEQLNEAWLSRPPTPPKRAAKERHVIPPAVNPPSYIQTRTGEIPSDGGPGRVDWPLRKCLPPRQQQALRRRRRRQRQASGQRGDDEAAESAHCGSRDRGREFHTRACGDE